MNTTKTAGAGSAGGRSDGTRFKANGEGLSARERARTATEARGGRGGEKVVDAGRVAATRTSARGRRIRSLIRVLEHELRTPLATSLIQLSAAETALDSSEPQAVRASIEGAARQLRTLSTIIRRVVQIENDEPLDLYPQRLDLGQLVVDFVGRRRIGARGSSLVEVRAQKGLVGDWDAAAVEQILENLLSNALKFGEGRPVLLTVAATRGSARLCVKDTGAGIDAKDRDRIFGRFARGSSTNGIAGMGVGLWVVQHLVRAHGGRVLVRSRPGKGTIVEIALPQLGFYPASASASRSIGTASGGANVLVLRDSNGPMRSSPCSAAKRTRSPTL
jgi:signal transduction histidine kinase